MGWKAVILATSFALVACGAEEGPGGTPANAGGEPDAGPEMPPDETPATASVVGLVVKPLPSISRAEGVTMTIVGHPEIDAVLSGEDGVFTFPEVPANTDLVVRGELDGYVAVASRVFNTGERETSLDIMFMLETESLPLLADISEVEMLEDSGLIMGAAVKRSDGSTMAGIEAGTDSGDGVVRYAGDNGFIDPERTETSSQGSFVVWNLVEGEYTASAGSDTNDTCRSTGLDDVTSPTVRIFPNTLTHVQFACD